MDRRGSVQVVEGDITRVRADALVNAANSELQAGGGVCGALFRAAGMQKLTEACRVIGNCPTGSAVLTPAFDITTARYIIHAVGPFYSSHSELEARRLLRSAYASAIGLAVEHGCKSIAFPAISTGIYGYPLEAACREAVDVCVKEAQRTDLSIKLVAFDRTTADCLSRHVERHDPLSGEAQVRR